MKRSLRNAALVGMSLVGLVGVLHLPALRPLLASLAGCPFPTSARVLSPEEAEDLRVHTFAPQHATVRASAMPALSFALGKDDRGSVQRWAEHHGISCKADRHGASLRCAEVRADVLGVDHPEAGLLGLGFDSKGTLVSVQFSLREADRERALAVSRRAEASLASAGQPAVHRTSDLRGALAQRQMLIALHDFRGEVTTTHMGRHFHVSQSYQRFLR